MAQTYSFDCLMDSLDAKGGSLGMSHSELQNHFDRGDPSAPRLPSFGQAVMAVNDRRMALQNQQLLLAVRDAYLLGNVPIADMPKLRIRRSA